MEKFSLMAQLRQAHTTTKCVNYWDSAFGNASAVHLYPLQSVLNAAARVITRKIVFLQQSVISDTGCQLNNGLTTSCALLFTM